MTILFEPSVAAETPVFEKVGIQGVNQAEEENPSGTAGNAATENFSMPQEIPLPYDINFAVLKTPPSPPPTWAFTP